MNKLDWFKKKEPTLSKNIDLTEQQVVEIFQELLANSQTKLQYDPETYECFLEREPYLMVIDSGKAIVVNSIYSHEVKISVKTEIFMNSKFSKELSKRRQALKAKYLSKVEKNLGTILDDVKKLSQ